MTPESPPVTRVSRMMADEAVDEREVARRLGFDPGDRGGLVDLAAVGIARLAWRDGPVEDWHAVPCRRISDSELMRASAAVTRLIRGVLDAELPASPWPRPAVSAEGNPDRLFAQVADVVADPSRSLADGRTVAQFASGKAELAALRRHVDECADCWTCMAEAHGLSEVLLVLACDGAFRCRRWWLAPDWPYLIDEFARRVDDPLRWDDEIAARVRSLARPPGAASGDELRRHLAEGPDRLTAEQAAFCLRAGLGALYPGDYGRPLPLVSRRVMQTLWRHLAIDGRHCALEGGDRDA